MGVAYMTNLVLDLVLVPKQSQNPSPLLLQTVSELDIF